MFFYSEQVGSVDPYAANVSLLLKGDGANNSTSFVDSSANNFNVSRAGNNAIISTAQSKFGGSSIYLDGQSSLYVPDNDAFTFDADFTIEAWVYITNTGGDRSIINHWNNISSFSFRVSGGKLYLAYGIGGSDVGIQATSTTVSANTWTHIAVTRSGSTVRFFVNGVQDSSTFTVAGAFNNGANVVDIGGFSINGSNLNNSYSFLGYMDDLRVTKGVARYTANFTPPDAL